MEAWMYPFLQDLKAENRRIRLTVAYSRRSKPTYYRGYVELVAPDCVVLRLAEGEGGKRAYLPLYTIKYIHEYDS